MEERLKQIASLVDDQARIADIGTDHAYLPIELVKDAKISFAIASDIAQGPLNNAKKDILAAGLVNQIETRLGSGLLTIHPEDKIDTVVMAGMGGTLMVNLLNASPTQYPTLILEPNVGEANVRLWLMNNNYRILAEKIIETAGHIYEIIKAVKSTTAVPLTEIEINFGPVLMQNKNKIFYKKWSNQLLFQQKLLHNLKKAKVIDDLKVKQVTKLIMMIEEMIKDDES